MGKINWFSVVLTGEVSRPQNAGRLDRNVRTRSQNGYPNRNADAKLIAAAPELLNAASAALHYMRLHQYADQAWADDLEAAIAAAIDG